MTDDRMALIELIEKDADTDLVREMLSFAAERLMEAEVEARTRAGLGDRSPGRLVQLLSGATRCDTAPKPSSVEPRSPAKSVLCPTAGVAALRA